MGSKNNSSSNIIDLTKDNYVDLTKDTPTENNLNTLNQTTLLNSKLNIKDSTNTNSLKYGHGECRLTHTLLHSSKAGESIKLEELIEKKSVKKVIATTFVLDSEWFLDYIPDSCSLCLVESSQGANIGFCHLSDNKLLIRPKLRPWDKVHSKLMLIVYDGFIRLVIGSPNLLLQDWGLLENMVFFQDFNELPEPSVKYSEGIQSELKQILDSLTVPPSVYKILLNYDFTPFKGELVYSVPNSRGSFPNNGIDSLAHKLKSLYPEQELNDKKNISMTYAASSIGRITTNFITKFVQKLYPISEDKINFQVIFPTVKTVESSILGPDIANNCLFLNKSFYNDRNACYFFKYNNINEGNLCHTKLIIGDHSEDGSGPHWFYVGSHNFSSAAWGHASSPSNTIKNHELGVLFRFQDCPLIIPFEYPSKQYDTEDIPWMFNDDTSAEKRSQQDQSTSSSESVKKYIK